MRSRHRWSRRILVAAFAGLVAGPASCGGNGGTADPGPADAPVAEVPEVAPDLPEEVAEDAWRDEEAGTSGDLADGEPRDLPTEEAPPEDAARDEANDAVPEDAPDAALPPTCPDGTPRRPWIDAADTAALMAVAGDLEIPTTSGSWGLKANWSGCESLLFVPDQPRQNQGWPDTFFRYNVNTFLFHLPRTAHVFFVSMKADAAERDETMAVLQQRIDAYLAGAPAADAQELRSRLHVVTGAGADLPGWLGTLLKSPGWGVAIDRFQRIRFLGSFADYALYDAGKQWFAPNLRMAANEAVYYDFEAVREADLQSRPATVVPVFTGEVLSDPGWAGTRGYADVTLPDAATMAGFDTLELDLALGCDGDGEYGTCPAWDYIVHLYLCDRDAPETCDVELGRWITTYHRRGRWVHDVSPLLPVLRDGGARRLAFYTQQPYAVELSLRLSDSGRATRPSEARFLFPGGDFGPGYNDGRLPVTVPIPADAARVTLAVVATGHGGADPGNCAEFCTTTHHFTVNGVEHVVSFPGAGSAEGCMLQTVQGTVPNQYGTWWYGRNGWCPGREVAMQVIDVTAQAPAGTDAVVEYRSLYDGAAYPSSGAGIVLSSWLVVERARAATR